MPFYKKNNTALSRSRRIEKSVEKNGLRSLIFNTVGDKYKGEWKEDKKSGKGTLVTRNLDLYEGDFDRNYRHGFGVLAFEIPGTKVYGWTIALGYLAYLRQKLIKKFEILGSNQVYNLAYRGTWRNGWPEGYGLRIYKDGSYYLGEWKRGKRNGHGQMWYADSSWYHGEWVNDLKQGRGVFVRADGNRYEGSWYMDKKHGEGRFFFLATGQIQDGVWKDDYCAFSVMCDIPFRQTAIRPSVYPIPVCDLINRDAICANQKLKMLLGVKESCLSIASDESGDKLHVQNL